MYMTGESVEKAEQKASWRISSLLHVALLMVCLIGSYALRNNMGDVFITILFGFIGYEMRKFGFPRVSLILGLLLGNLAELAFRQSLMTEQGAMAFFTRPIALTILVLTIASLVWPYLQTYLKRRRAQQ